MIKKYVGIDVGVNGGIAILDGDRKLQLYSIPKIGTHVDYRELYFIIRHINNVEYVVIEDIHAIFGASAKSTFNFGYIAGMLLGIVISCEYKFELVQPKEWQKEIWTNADKVIKSNKRVDAKATSLLAAKRLFPGEKFLATNISRAPHDGLVDSALLAEYCLRRFHV